MAFDEELGYDPDNPRPPGTYPDGATFRYDANWYRYRIGGELTSVVRVTQRITGGSVPGGQTIHRYLTYRKYVRLRPQGMHMVFNEGETHDDMEFFLRRLEDAERGVSGLIN